MKEFLGYTKAFFVAILTLVFALTVSVVMLGYYCLTIYVCFARPGSLGASAMFIVAMLTAFKSFDFMAWIDGLNSKNLDNYLKARERFLSLSSAQ